MTEEGTRNGDKLILQGLKFHGFHGVHDEEKKLGQKFLVDLDAWLDLQKPGESDNLDDTVSYTAIYRLVKEVMEGPPHALIESVANSIASGIIKDIKTQLMMCCFHSSVAMALQQKSQQVYFHIKAHNCPLYLRSYKTKVEWRKLRPMILERIKQRAKDYPVTSMIPVALDVLKARGVLIEGVSNILQIIPVKACRHCSEVCIGHVGHHIQTCRGPKWGAKNLVHEWIEGNINDILVPVESFHLYDMFQNVIKHDERFDFDRIPAVVELCIQAGVDLPEYPTNRTNRSPNTEYGSAFQLSDHTSENVSKDSVKAVDKIKESPFILPTELHALAKRTLHAWERTRLGTKKLMLVYPVKVCQFCSEIHIGPSGHKARLCGIFKYQSWRGHHMWKSADLDDLIPPRYVWHIHEQDVRPLLDEGRGYYGHAPAVVELCVQAGAPIPRKYHCMMKTSGLRSA